MKTKQYVKKYKLNKGDKFNRQEFISDLALDFLTLLEVHNPKGDIRKFNNAVNDIRDKFDAINNKTLGYIPESLWNYFFATVIAKAREEFCPQWCERKEREMQERKAKQKQEREEEKRKEQEFRQQEEKIRDQFFNTYMNYINSIYNLLSFSKTQPPNQSFAYFGLDHSASQEEVKREFRKKSFKLHPDTGGSKKQFVEAVEHKNACLAYLQHK